MLSGLPITLHRRSVFSSRISLQTTSRKATAKTLSTFKKSIYTMLSSMMVLLLVSGRIVILYSILNSQPAAGDDVYHEPDQSKPCVPFIEGLLKTASGKDKEGNPLLLPKDLSLYSGKRRADAKATNPEYTTSFGHRMFGSSKYVPLTDLWAQRLICCLSNVVPVRC